MKKHTKGFTKHSMQDSSFFDNETDSPQGSIRNQNPDQIS